jgi:3-phosphoshikimate 1-carboxyvinyltransferase
MALPDLIEIIPSAEPVQARVTVPGSKSITNRALILAALGAGKSTLLGALWSEDTQVMVDCLQRLGFEIQVEQDPGEPCNRILTVLGQAGVIPRSGTCENPLELFVGNAGTAARFLSALVCLGNGFYRLHGVERMHSRPQAALFEALRALGYPVESQNNKLPALFCGKGPRKGSCKVSVDESSQFASALLLCSKTGKWNVEIGDQDADEMPYVTMTQALIEAFPPSGGPFQIEPDTSSSSYFCAANWLLAAGNGRGAEIQIANYPRSNWQIDTAFPAFLPLPARVSRQQDLGDSIMTAIVLAPFADQPKTFTDLGRLRLQECERVEALKTELLKCGAKVAENGQTLTLFPSKNDLHGAEIETYNDHRMAMCFAILGLKVSGIRLKNPACVKKTFPNFFQKLAASPQNGGLGVRILNARTQKVLQGHELFAE